MVKKEVYRTLSAMHYALVKNKYDIARTKNVDSQTPKAKHVNYFHIHMFN